MAGMVPVVSRRIRIGFLGAGHSHAEAKLRLVRDSPEWELVGVAEDASSRERILRDESVEVIAVESEVARHAADGLAALLAGKHVHLEKPPADNMRDMRALVEAARKQGRLLQMGYMWRHHPGISKALEAARQGWLGEVYLVRGTMNTLIGADRRPEWAQFRGGQMFEQGAHLLDPMVRLLGRPRKITPFLRTHGAFGDSLKDNTVAVLEYPRGLGIVMSNVLQPNAGPHRAFEVFGSNGSAVVRPVEPAALEIDLAKAAGPYAVGRQKVDLPLYRRYEGDFAELARCVRQNQPLSVSLEEDLLIEEVLLEASEML